MPESAYGAEMMRMLALELHFVIPCEAGASIRAKSPLDFGAKRLQKVGHNVYRFSSICQTKS